MIENRATREPDVILVGAGIMSATLGVFLKELEPTLNISMVETLDGAALESSDAWNNAGTGHAANCELNYIRLSRGRRRRVAAPAKVRNPGGQGLRRISGQRHLAALR